MGFNLKMNNGDWKWVAIGLISGIFLMMLIVMFVSGVANQLTSWGDQIKNLIPKKNGDTTSKDGTKLPDSSGKKEAK